MRFSSEYFHFNDKEFDYFQSACMDTGGKTPFGRLGGNGSTLNWFHNSNFGVIFNSNLPRTLEVSGQLYFNPSLSSTLLHNALCLLVVDFACHMLMCTFKPISF